jgi:cyclic beta-1,2-glucan synthetase
VIANPYFGTVVSESGGAYTWCENARNYRLTPWHNDPVGDASGEAFYLRDEHDGRFWSPTPRRPAAASRTPPATASATASSSTREDGIVSEMRTFVAIDAPLKFMLFKLSNRSGRARRLSLTALFELVLGEHRAGNLPYVVTEVDPGSGALLARNSYASEFSRRVAFLDCSEAQRSSPATAASSSAATAPGRPGVHGAGAPVGPRRRRPRPVPGDAGDGRPGRRPGARAGVQLRLGHATSATRAR